MASLTHFFGQCLVDHTETAVNVLSVFHSTLLKSILTRELICEDPELDKFYFSEYLLEHSLIIEAITWLGKEGVKCFFVDFCFAGYINSSLNPIIYAFMKADIKTGLLSMVGRGRQK